MVLIEPLATMAAVEEFLWPRIFRSESDLTAEASTEADDRSKVTNPLSTPLLDIVGPGLLDPGHQI